jgi:hypothetical protein
VWQKEWQVSVSSEANYSLKMEQYMRAATRVNSRIMVEVEWLETGTPHRAVGYTVDISPKGCMAIVPQGFVLGQKLRLKNRSNGNLADATLIWRGHEGRSGWELGLELVNPPTDFWGLDF